MSKSLEEIAEELKKNAEKSEKPKKVQIIYAFNGTGKTRLSMEFKKLVSPKTILEKEIAKENENLKKFEENLEKAKRPEGKNKLNKMIEGIKGNIRDKENELSNPPDSRTKILYYNALTEDLFYWNNEFENEFHPTLKIQSNNFVNWVLHFFGDKDIIENFHRYTNTKLTPIFSNQDYDNEHPNRSWANEVSFSYEGGDERSKKKIKISHGEERCFIWSIFYTLIYYVLGDISEQSDESEFKDLKYIFIDDPVSSLDDNYLILLAVDLSKLIKSYKSTNINFIITTHNALFYNVLFNELDRDDPVYEYKGSKNAICYVMRLQENGTYQLNPSNDSPFSYHLYLKKEIESAIKNNSIQKYHFHFVRQILEKLSTFLGYKDWSKLLPEHSDYLKRLINLSSHAKYATEEISEIIPSDKEKLKELIDYINKKYHFNEN
ncbi:AAA family ATPase [Mannheimia sp. ZY171111]|uniref:AAA family ATPase n=1 Tax=Mannheimia sp. ZY171111 TaxID=2679995 RepID=UPI001ADDC84A|nr:AAA family ATPase [Mannheimia sp. ZY171111]QTM00392.1 AAA family ATPase [Mannheimia sp. ZY171111]